jgi:phosphatidylglycerol---prolipoprotein diacylglyceryl transferase
MSFPFYIPIGPWQLHPHWVFESLAYFVGFRIYLALRRGDGDPITERTRWSVIAAAIVGAALGSRVLYLLESPALTLAHISDPAFLLGGKTIVGGLIGGLLAVEGTKRWLGERAATGDLFAVPLALGIAVGRIGCFLTGIDDHTTGIATMLPWGLDYGDGIRRHPAPLYEVVATLALAMWLYGVRRSRARQGDLFKQFMVAYMGFRLIVDSVKADPNLAWGLSTVQCAALLTLGYYAGDIVRWWRFEPRQRSLEDGTGPEHPVIS